MKKILFVYTDFFALHDIAWAFLELEYEMEFYDGKFLSYRSDPELADAFSKHLEQDDYWFVLSYNFCPDISRVCEKKKLPYVCWTYDCLMLPMHTKQITSPYNFTHIFDSEEYGIVKRDFDPPHLYYMPLAANLSRLGGTVITREDEEKFRSEISFVGNLYDTDEYQQLEDKDALPPPVKDFFHYLFDYYTGRWNGESIYDCLDANTCQALNRILPVGLLNKYEIDDAYYLAFTLLGRKIANSDRMLVLKSLSERFPVSLFGPVKELDFPVAQKGSVEYTTEFAKAAYLSKINLHLTIPRIINGVSLRCFDIMGSGGFLMANYRKDMLDLFVPGEDFVMYSDIDDLVRKTEYYLKHDAEREQIARNGFLKVASCHTCIHRAKEMVLHLEEAGYGLGCNP